MELWAGNERAQRSLELAGLEADVIAVPSGLRCRRRSFRGIFRAAIILRAWCLRIGVGHGYQASLVARHIHKLLHKFHDIRDTAGLLAH